MRLSLYIIAFAVTLVYLGTLHDEARWQADVRSEAIQAENFRVHQATEKYSAIWSQVHPMTYVDLCHIFVRYGTLDQTSANYYIRLNAIRAPGDRMTVTYPNGPVPVITGQADVRPAATVTTEL